MPDPIMCEYCDTRPATVKDYRDLGPHWGGLQKYLCCDMCFTKADASVKRSLSRVAKKKSLSTINRGA